MAYTHAYVSSVEPLQISSTRSLSIRWSLPADASNTKAVARDSTESIFDPHRLLCEPCVVEHAISVCTQCTSFPFVRHHLD
eukprot:COSAG03_NODE_276_length_9556_cov_8.462360_6_plen_81_part_00